jgi:hypothetical protein
VLVLEGPVDEAMRQQFQAAVESRPITAVRITSNGNRTRNNPRNMPALWMADAIRERGIEVIVRGMCAESCANYIFVAGRKRRVEQNSLVLFGPSVTTLQGTRQVIGDLFPPDFEPMFRSLDGLVSAEQRLFELRGAPLALLRDSSLARQPNCLVFYRTHGTTPQSFSVSLTYAAWVPSRQYLADAGLEMEGYARRNVTPFAPARQCRSGAHNSLCGRRSPALAEEAALPDAGSAAVRAGAGSAMRPEPAHAHHGRPTSDLSACPSSHLARDRTRGCSIRWALCHCGSPARPGPPGSCRTSR